VRGILTSGARVETLVGPAGTGKSFVVGTLARAWTDPTLVDNDPMAVWAGVRAGDRARWRPRC
jgi:MoxR-like ATPase